MAADTCLSPTGVSITAMPASRMATWKPWFDITVTTTASPPRLLQPGGEHGHDLVAVQRLTVRVNGEAPVGVPVVGDTGVRAVLRHRGGQRAERGGTAALVDVQAVRLVPDGDDLGAR